MKPPRYVVVVSLLVLCALATKSSPAVPAGEARDATSDGCFRACGRTNTFGVMALTQAVLPQFRARRSSVVVNVTSSATLKPMPLVAVYTASKMAIEGFTGSLAHELKAFNVRVKLVEPGYGPSTRFTQNGSARMEGG
jgi:short-subunit dehydrogenase